MADLYTDVALAEVKKQGLTAEQVASLHYADIAALCGVKIEANGNSPRDFFYEIIRAKLVARLNNEVRLAALESERVAYETAIKNLPGYSGKIVIAEPDGTFKIASSIQITEVK